MNRDRSPTRRSVLQSMAGGAVVPTAVASSPGDRADPNSMQEMYACFRQWKQAPDQYPTIDISGERARTNDAVPEAPEELVIYANGWLSQGSYGANQAYTFEQALRAEEYEHPVVFASWRANDLRLSVAGEHGDEDGVTLADWIQSLQRRHPETTIHLAGLSLGVRVVLATIEALDDDVTVETASIFGGAVFADRVCADSQEGYDPDAVDASVNRIYNYHSTYDDTICQLYNLMYGEGLGCLGDPCAKDRPEAYVSVDVTDQITSHCQYQMPEVGIVSKVVQTYEQKDLPHTPDPQETI